MTTLTRHSHLHAVAAVMQRRHGSLREAGSTLLRALIDQLGVRTAYLARVDREDQVLRVLVVESRPDGCALQHGSKLCLSQTFCAGISDSGTSDTLAINDISRDPRYQSHPIVSELSSARSYLGARITLADGSQFGTLAAIDRVPREITPDDVDFVQALACFIARQIDRERIQKRLDVAATAQRAVNVDLERVNHVRSDFVKIASHEFRTALAGIQGFSEMIRDEDLSLAEIREFADDINTDAHRLNTMIDEMLNLDRLEAGQIDLAMVPTDLNAIVRSVVPLLLQPGSDTRINLRSSGGLIVNGDRGRLAEVIERLVQHAITRSPAGGEIDVATGAEGGVAHVDIRDRGQGMTQPQINSMFDLASHVDAETGHFRPAAGFGLAIVRQIVELHGGSVWTKSNGVSGAQVHLTIPLAEISG